MTINEVVLARRIIPMDTITAKLKKGDAPYPVDPYITLEMTAGDREVYIILTADEARKLAACLYGLRGDRDSLMFTVEEGVYIHVVVNRPDATIVMCKNGLCGRVRTDSTCSLITGFPELIKGWFP